MSRKPAKPAVNGTKQAPSCCCGGGPAAAPPPPPAEGTRKPDAAPGPNPPAKPEHGETPSAP